MLLDRRQFVAVMGAVAAGSALRAADSGKLKAAIIGHTGHGDYGHGMDVAFAGIETVEVVAVADPDEAGRGKAMQRSGAKRGYADYREMLAKEKPAYVSIGPRWTEGRKEMILAAVKTGAHLYCEKPFVTFPGEGDEIMAAQEATNAKIAVAHQMRLSPGVVAVHKAIEEGMIGELAQIRAWGKQDHRAGGEDMMVLGTHMFDLMRFFAGDPVSCSSRVMWKGKEITKKDARAATEKVGPVAGDSIWASFAFEKGAEGSFTSVGKLREHVGHWGMELIGSKGAVRLKADVDPAVYVLKSGKWEPTGRTDQWVRWEGDVLAKAPADKIGFGPANRRMVENLIVEAFDSHEPPCSEWDGTKAVEMVMAVYWSALEKRRVEMPLKERGHALM